MRCFPGPRVKTPDLNGAEFRTSFSFPPEYTGLGTPSTEICSRSTAGWGSFDILTRGSIMTAPFKVGNQSWPDAVFRPAGQNPPAHSSDNIPSALPKTCG